MKAAFCLTILETRRLLKIVNGYEDIDMNMFFKHKEGSRTRAHKATCIVHGK